jgi:hypothetical protein
VGTARQWRHIHAGLTIAWLILIIPSMLLWKDSVPWLVFMSVWANVAGSFGSWQAARAEESE